MSVDDLTALSAMKYVIGHVSVGEYGYLELNNLTLPTDTADSILAAQAGICGHAEIAMEAILAQLGYQVRTVLFYYTYPDGRPDGHNAVEVYYGGGWHFFDPTFDLYWTGSDGSIMSIGDVRANGGVEHKDDSTFTNLIEDPWFGGDDTAFETDPATVVKVVG